MGIPHQVRARSKADHPGLQHLTAPDAAGMKHGSNHSLSSSVWLQRGDPGPRSSSLLSVELESRVSHLGVSFRDAGPGSPATPRHVHSLDSSESLRVERWVLSLNSQLSTLNSQLSTLNSQLSTLNSQLSTFFPEIPACSVVSAVSTSVLTHWNARYKQESRHRMFFAPKGQPHCRLGCVKTRLGTALTGFSDSLSAGEMHESADVRKHTNYTKKQKGCR